MPLPPFTENYDDYLQSSEDEFKDLQDRSFQEQQLIRSAAERDPRQYRGIGYGGLTGEEKEAVAAAGMELPQNLIARENVQQKYRRAAQAKGFGFDQDTQSTLAEKVIEAEKVTESPRAAGMEKGGFSTGEGEGPDMPDLEGTMDMATAKQMLSKLWPYVAQLGITGLVGMSPIAMVMSLAKNFAKLYGVKALKGLYDQVMGTGSEKDFAGGFQEVAASGDVEGIAESYEKGMEQIGSTAREGYVGPGPAGIDMGTFSAEDLSTPGFSGFASIDPEHGDVEAGDFVYGGIGSFDAFGGEGGEGGGGFGGGGMGGGRGGETEGESDPSGGMGGY